MEYLITVDAPAYRLSPTTFALESAFAHHLKRLASSLSPTFERLHLVAPAMSESYYRSQKAHLAEIQHADGISFVPMQDMDVSAVDWWRLAPAAFRSLWDTVRRVEVVHAGLSSDLRRPLGFVATLSAVLQKKHSLFVVDIDFRHSASMNYRTKRWSLKSYLVCKYVYDPLRVAQIRFAARWCSLVLLKSPRMVEAFGGARSHVKDFFDTAHSVEHVIDASVVARREKRLDRQDEPLRLVYFGRLVDYKGIDRSIRAVRHARKVSGRDLQLQVIGAGPDEPKLHALVESLGMQGSVTFRKAVPYGPELFRALEGADLLLATPLAEDTPRSAFDGLAAGLPIAAFDLSYYRDLEQSGAVVTVPWPEVNALSAQICELDEDRARMKRMTQAAVAFARANTQEIWLERRARWTLELLRNNTVETICTVPA